MSVQQLHSLQVCFPVPVDLYNKHNKTLQPCLCYCSLFLPGLIELISSRFNTYFADFYQQLQSYFLIIYYNVLFNQNSCYFVGQEKIVPCWGLYLKVPQHKLFLPPPHTSVSSSMSCQSLLSFFSCKAVVLLCTLPQLFETQMC